MVLLAQYQTGTRWYNTFLCFWLGMVYAQIKPKYEKWFRKIRKILLGLSCFGNYIFNINSIAKCDVVLYNSRSSIYFIDQSSVYDRSH